MEKLKAGRKDKYEEFVKPRLKEISDWIGYGMTESQVWKNLGIGKNTWYRYKRDHEELRDSVKSGAVPLVKMIRGALAERALGLNYTEKKTVRKQDSDGDITIEEIYERYAPPDVAACNLMLKNLDKDNWCNDPQLMAFKQADLKHRQQVEKNKEFHPAPISEEDNNAD